jgi:hypothetical protein
MSGAASTRGGEATPFGLLAAKLTAAPLSRKTRLKLERGDSPRSGQPVWRNSYYEGQCEARIWRRYGDGTARTGKRLHALILKAARRLERDTRRKRQEEAERRRRGLLGDVGLEVLDFLWSRVDFFTGRLEPAIATIADELGRSYSAVHRALKHLRAHGFLQWERRSKPIENPEPGGPLVEQIPNAYVLLIPKALQSFFAIEIGGKRPPAPDCVTWDRQQAREEFDRMLSQLTVREWFKATWQGDSRLGETLANIARMVEERESSIARETGGDHRSP